MNEKLPVVTAYIAIGLGLSLMPLLLAGVRPSLVGSQSRNWQTYLVGCGALSLMLLSGSTLTSWPLLPAILAASLIGAWQAKRLDLRIIVALFASLVVATTLPWWRWNNGTFSASLWEIVAVYGVSVIIFRTLMRKKSPETQTSLRATSFLLGLFALLAVFFSFNTSVYESPTPLGAAWHHWGAYVGPAEILSTGAAIFRDVPAQYGLGPTLLLNAACTGNCWMAMYFVAGCTTLLYGLLILFTVAAISKGQNHTLQTGLILLVAFVATFLWTAYPPNVATTFMTPSVSGLRFLPIAALATALILTDRNQSKKQPPAAMHLLWVLGAIWSPESAFYVTFLWWPYYLWRSCMTRPNQEGMLAAILKAAAVLLIWLFSLVTVFFAIYHMIYGGMPTLIGYLAYALSPPGPMPINKSGTVWFFAALLFISSITAFKRLRTAPEARDTRALIVILLATYAASSYYFLGRSHDNNILNLSPLMVLLLAATWSSVPGPFIRSMTAGLLASLLAYLALFGWSEWKDAYKNGLFVRLGPESMITKLNYESNLGKQAILVAVGTDNKNAVPSDASRGIIEISQRFHEPVTVLDAALVLQTSSAGAPWSAIHGPANFTFIPSAMRREFLARTARKLGKSGWLLISRDFPAKDWIEDFESAYNSDVKLDFGSYYAIRYTPRANQHSSVEN
ncbi:MULTISPECIES: hypothetical protein [unclassified Cupriavidus]|uniref:hypothetical protein n=1 Tax=unclassified Cupriavidus TaxID=2640874 RepID=UPI001F2F26AA|nr:hypothetical protein [Cupriavidus sp. SK-3]